MFSWIKKVFTNPASEVREREPEAQVVKKMSDAIANLSKEGEIDPAKLKNVEMLMKDFKKRSLKEDKRGTSSSPISSS